MQDYTVKLFDKEYRIKSDGSREDINRIAGYINEHLKNLQASSFVGTRIDLAIMVAFTAASDYFQIQGDFEKLRRKIEKDTAELTARIDEKLTGGVPRTELS